MRRDHLDAILSQLRIQRIAVIGAIADRGRLATEGELYKRSSEARCLLEMTLERLEELREIGQP
jgi:hypothetical protein